MVFASGYTYCGRNETQVNINFFIIQAEIEGFVKKSQIVVEATMLRRYDGRH
jgi:hypothetical protein